MICGAFKETSSSGGFSIHDNHENTVADGAGNIQRNTSHIQAEAVACFQALDLAASIGVSNVGIETETLALCSTLISS